MVAALVAHVQAGATAVAFEAPPPPPFSGPPHSQLGVTIPMRVVLASDPTIVIAMTDCAAYSNGFEFSVAVRSGEDLDPRLVGFRPPIPPDAKEPDGLFRITVRFADGGSASSGQRAPGPELMDYYLAKRDGLEPKLPKGPATAHEWRWWWQALELPLLGLAAATRGQPDIDMRVACPRDATDRA